MPLSKTACFLLAICFLTGCSSQGINSNQIADSQSSYDEAVQKAGAGDSAAALPLLDIAIDNPGLDADQLTEAILLRSRCRAQTGDSEGAAADLEDARQGDASEALMKYTEGFVLKSKGDAAGAKRAFSAARRLDSSLKPPK